MPSEAEVEQKTAEEVEEEKVVDSDEDEQQVENEELNRSDDEEEVSRFAGTLLVSDWLIVWCLMLFQLHRGSQCTYPGFPGVLLTSTSHSTLSKPLAAFPHKNSRNNVQHWERNESCGNGYHQYMERTLAEPEVQTSNLLFSSPLDYDTNWVKGSLLVSGRNT